MNEEIMRQMQAQLQEINELLRGKGAEGGLVHATLTLAAIIHGTKENPGGMVRRIEDHDSKFDKVFKIIYMGSGAAFVINVGWMVFTHFHK